MIVTTSWDDGDARDIRIADLLDRYSLRGTFYITRDQVGRLSEDAIRDLSERYEVGVHTLSHPFLPECSTEEKRKEIIGGKEWLEQIIGKEAPMFCYPYGRFDEETKQIVAEAGFIGARTAVKTLGTIPTDPFELPVTIMAYRQPFGIKERVLLPIQGTRVSNHIWERLIREKFNTVRKENGVFHLWGHSWELDRFNLWSSLEAFLKEISEQPDTRYLTNGELTRHLFGTTL